MRVWLIVGVCIALAAPAAAEDRCEFLQQAAPLMEGLNRNAVELLDGAREALPDDLERAAEQGDLSTLEQALATMEQALRDGTMPPSALFPDEAAKLMRALVAAARLIPSLKALVAATDNFPPAC